MEKIENPLTVTENKKGNVLILSINGKLDTITAPILEKQVFQIVNTGQNKLLLNFAGVNYINSAGLRMLLSIKKQVKSLSGKLIVCCMTSEVMEIMKMCGFDHVLDIADTEENGLQKFL